MLALISRHRREFVVSLTRTVTGDAAEVHSILELILALALEILLRVLKVLTRHHRIRRKHLLLFVAWRQLQLGHIARVKLSFQFALAAHLLFYLLTQAGDGGKALQSRSVATDSRAAWYSASHHLVENAPSGLLDRQLRQVDVTLNIPSLALVRHKIGRIEGGQLALPFIALKSVAYLRHLGLITFWRLRAGARLDTIARHLLILLLHVCGVIRRPLVRANLAPLGLVVTDLIPGRGGSHGRIRQFSVLGRGVGIFPRELKDG